MNHNGTTPDMPEETGCCEPRDWLETGIFPVEYTDTGGPDTELDPDFTLVIDRLWRAVLADPDAQAAYRRYEPLPWAEITVELFVNTLSYGALKRFLTAARANWHASPVQPTCDHIACHETWLETLDALHLPPKVRLQQWVTMALAERVDGQSRWPALTASAPATGNGRSAPRRWPRPRPLPWEDGDSDAGR